MTWSIVAHDPHTGAFAVAVTTCAFAVGASCPFVQPGVGAVSTQSITNRYLGPAVLAGLARGLGARSPPLRGHWPAMTASTCARCMPWTGTGRTAAWTGRNCVSWCGSEASGRGSAWPATCWPARRWWATPWPAIVANGAADLSERLMDALDAGQHAGGDRRGRQSAAMVLTTTEDFPDLNLRVDDHADPLGRAAPPGRPVADRRRCRG